VNRQLGHPRILGELGRLLVALLSLLAAGACGRDVEWGEHTQQRMLCAVAEQQLGYWLYTPPEAYEAPPLLLFLHGSGERGDELELVKAHGPPRLIGREEALAGFFVVSPQCPADEWWQSDTLAALVAEVLDANPRIDEDRLYVTGLSMGGYGTWSLIVDFPGLFAAAAPICGGGELNRMVPDLDPNSRPTFRHEWLEGVRDLPIWAFHGEEDATIPIEETLILVEALRELGSDVRLTTYPGVGHDSWTMAYADPELYAWLRAQTRGLR